MRQNHLQDIRKCSSVRRDSRRRGVTLVYLSISIVTLIGLCSLAVDLARVQMVKTELRRAADSAARYGAMALPNGSAAATANAIAAAADNIADGTTVVITSANIQIGNWDTTKTPNFSTSRTPLNAVRVDCSRNSANGNATKLTFASILGKSTCDATAISVAALTSTASSMTLPVQATKDPWLAGMPSGTVANNPNPHNNPDYASVMSASTINSAIQYSITGSAGSFGVAGTGISWATSTAPTVASISHYSSWYPNSGTGSGYGSPMPAIGLPLTAGTALTFDNVSGNANYNYQTPTGTADGDTTTIMDNLLGAENGMSDLYAPVDSIIGVFLDDTQPSSSAAPAGLDFSTDAERNFSVLKPLLKQPFFIGDGRDNNGSPQQFVVPTGATRLFIGNMDSYEWNNDTGSFSISVHNTSSVAIVQ